MAEHLRGLRERRATRRALGMRSPVWRYDDADADGTDHNLFQAAMEIMMIARPSTMRTE